MVACYGAVKGRFEGCVGKEQRERRRGGEWEEWKSIRVGLESKLMRRVIRNRDMSIVDWHLTNVDYP